MTRKNKMRSEEHSVEVHKTEMCKWFLLNGECPYTECTFAHDFGELRVRPRPPGYRTKVCKSFAMTGSCRYAFRCKFSHVMDGSDDSTVAPTSHDSTVAPSALAPSAEPT